MKRQALGKGLDVLLPQSPIPAAALTELDLDQIQPNPLQPRMRFEPGKLQELAASIKENGVLQPIVVRASLQCKRKEILSKNKDNQLKMKRGKRKQKY